MQVPGALFAVDPRHRAADLRDEVIAPRIVAIPPTAGDALGTGEQDERRLIHADYFVEEPGGPRPGLHEFVRVPLAGLHPPPGIFGPVVGSFVILIMQYKLAFLGEWVLVIQGVIFVACVLLFRRGLIGELAHWLRIKL